MAKTVAAAAIGITADTTSARNELSHIRRILRETQEPTQKLEADIALLEKRINSSEQADQALISALEKKKKLLHEMQREISGVAQAEREAAELAKKQEMEKRAAELAIVKKAQEEYAERIRQANQIIKSSQTETERLREQIALLSRVYVENETVDAKLIKTIEQKKEALRKLNQEQKIAAEQARKVAESNQWASSYMDGATKQYRQQQAAIEAATVKQKEYERSLSMRFGSAQAFLDMQKGADNVATSSKGAASGLTKMALESTLATRAAGALGISTSTLATGGVAALGAALPVAYVGMNKLTAAALDQVDQQDDLARILGVSYNELKQFEFALSLAGGVSAGQATEGLRNLNRMVGEASLGMGKGRKIFEELGVSISDLAGMNAVEQFDAVSKAIANIEQPAARSAIAMKLFGDERIALAVGQMADQLAKAKESAKEFQLPLTDQQIQTAKELNDQMQQIAAVWNSFKVGAFALIGDTLIRINKELLTFATNLSNAKDSFFNFFGIKTSGQIAEMQRQIDEMNRQAEAAGKRVQTQGELEAQAAAQLQEELAGIAAAQDEVFKRQQASLQFRKDELNYGKRLAEINKAVREGMSDKQATQFVDEMIALEEREKKQKALVDQQAKQQQTLKDFEAVRKDAAMQSATEFDRVASQVRAFREQFAGVIGGDELAQVALEKFGPAMRAALTGSIPQIQAPSLVRAGSAEAYRMTIQPQIDQMQQQIDLQSQQLAEQQASNAILQEMSSNIANIQPAQRRR